MSMESGYPIKRLLVTGCCGFIGANFVRYLLETDPAIEITNLDALTYAGNPDNLADVRRGLALSICTRRYCRSGAGDAAGGHGEVRRDGELCR